MSTTPCFAAGRAVEELCQLLLLALVLWSVRLGFMVPFAMSTHLKQAGPPSVSDKETDEISYLSTSAWLDTAASCHVPSLKWGALGSCCLSWGAETPQTLSLPRESLTTGAEVSNAAEVALSATGGGGDQRTDQLLWEMGLGHAVSALC